MIRYVASRLVFPNEIWFDDEDRPTLIQLFERGLNTWPPDKRPESLQKALDDMKANYE